MPGGRTGLRVGLTGGLGSGKSTVAAMLAEKGAYVLSADEIGRSLMQPGTAVFDAIVQRFGPSAMLPDGTLNRRELARLAFLEGRVEELNSIIHPATIAVQGQLTAAIFVGNPHAIVVIESALIFETRHGDGWRDRFDHLVLVAAPDSLKVDRFVTRSGSGDVAAFRAEAHRRLAQMIPDEAKATQCDFVLHNDCSLADLRRHVDAMWLALRSEVL